MESGGELFTSPHGKQCAHSRYCFLTVRMHLNQMGHAKDIFIPWAVYSGLPLDYLHN